MKVLLLANVLLFLITLQPIHILSYGSTADSILDSILVSLPEYLVKITEETHITSVERIERSCTAKLEENLIDGEVTYSGELCISITNMKVSVSPFYFKCFELKWLQMSLNLMLCSCLVGYAESPDRSRNACLHIQCDKGIATSG